MAVSFAAATGLSGIAEVFPNRNLMRPPGALDERRFAESCIRCAACVEFCPIRAITIAHMIDGLRNIGTPVLSSSCMVFKGLEDPSPIATEEWRASVSHNGQETTCFECIKHCPTGSLQAVQPDKLRIGTAVIDKDRCLFYVQGACGAPCLRTCPFEAISLNMGPVVDGEKCVGCGQCSYICVTRSSGAPAIVVEPRQS
jgi:ferredoxin-type protein NapG